LSDTRWRDVSRFGWLRVTAAAISLAPAAYVIVTTLVMIITGWSPVPFWDHWDLLIFSPERIFSRWLFAQDNEVPVIPRASITADSIAETLVLGTWL